MLSKFGKMLQQARDEHKRQLWAAATQSSQPTGEGGRLPSRNPATAGVFSGTNLVGETLNKKN